MAQFLGRRLAYTYEIRELVPRRAARHEHRAGPVPDGDDLRLGGRAHGGTRMTLRNRGEPAGFAKIAAPVMAAAMRRAMRKDLRRLKAILEREP